MFSCLLLLAGLAAQAPAPAGSPAETPAVKARTHLLVAEAVRVDLRRRWLVVKTREQPPVELHIGVDEGRTRVRLGGRVVPFEDIRPGDRVAISCSDDASGAHTARLIVIRRQGVAHPAASPVPAASPRPPRT
jgi:hypothetical protein